MKTVLHVWSDKTDLRPYAARSKFLVKRSRSAQPGTSYRRLLRLKWVVSDREVGDIQGRVADINAFCQKHSAELKSLVDDPRIGGVFIDVPYHAERSATGSLFEPYLKAGMLSMLKAIGVGIQMTPMRNPEPNQ